MSLTLPRDPGPRYSPQSFLAALGAGGLVVTFFLWLLFWVPHPGRQVPVFEDIAAAFRAGGLLEQAMIALAALAILWFAVLHFRLLAWNLRALAGFRRTEAFAALRAGNAESQLLAAPLALAMGVNAAFILGLVFVPGLWSVVEYLFPVAMAAFVAIGGWALALLGAFYGRVLTKGGFDCAKNNSFAQMLPAFALAMVAVGLAAPASMSDAALTVGLAFILSSFFAVTAILLGTIQLMLGVRAMMENGANAEAAPTLWIAIPFVTVLAIALMRQAHGLHGEFGVPADKAANFVLLTRLLAVQLAFGLLGLVVLRRVDYFRRFVTGPETSVGSYALVCPGVALAVMVQFWVNRGLVPAGLVERFSAGYWALTAIALALQAASIWLLLRLNAKHFGPAPRPAAVPAE